MLINESKDPYGYNTSVNYKGIPDPQGRSTVYEQGLNEYYEKYAIARNTHGITASNDVMYPKCNKCHKEMSLVAEVNKKYGACTLYILTEAGRKRFLKPTKSNMGNRYIHFYLCTTCKTHKQLESVTQMNFKNMRPKSPNFNSAPAPSHEELHGLTPTPTECPTCYMIEGECLCVDKGLVDNAEGFQTKAHQDYLSFANRDELLQHKGDKMDKIIPRGHDNSISNTLYCASHWDAVYTLPNTQKPPKRETKKVETVPVKMQRTAEKYTYRVPEGGNSAINNKFLKHSKAEAGDTITVIIKELITLDHVPVPRPKPVYQKRPAGKSLLPFINSGQRHGL